DGFAIVLFSDENRFLSSAGLNLKFSNTDKLSFTWGKAEDYGIETGIKVTGAAQAKVYGVAGGVKIVNASGAVSVYTVDGRLVTTQAVTSPDQTVAVPAGIYIVKNGANVAKVVVK
ncbi:MAG: T9SS type A sorting domain-containing protein, partial [Dysgonamonadaceae bacterium]|nr:T9SS type A sorting domain-containing protein [Dysgonamonadaceae bacterium]